MSSDKLLPLPVHQIAADSAEAAFFLPALDGEPTPTRSFNFQRMEHNAAEVETPVVEPVMESVVAVSETEIRIAQLEQMLKDAKAHAEQQESEAYTAAYANGEKAGLALGESRADGILNQLEQQLAQADQQVQHMQQASADAIIDLTQVIAETLIGELPSNQHAWLLKAAAKVADAMPLGDEPLQLAVHPDDLAEIKNIASEQQPQPWRLVADANLASGSCRLVSAQQDALIDPIHSVAELVRQMRPELQASIHIPPDA
ncbi:MAG: FliH/SctL family protein [Mariprofundales bacterium]|nr:FliH/SctL family protein [Mariprofundales bacterium]